MIAGSASFTNVPVHGVLPVGVSTNVAAGPTGLSIGRPSASADLAVDLAERGREVHDAGAVVDGHEVGGDHPRRRRRPGSGERASNGRS